MKTFVIAVSLLASVLATSVGASAAEPFDGRKFFAEQSSRSGD